MTMRSYNEVRSYPFYRRYFNAWRRRRHRRSKTTASVSARYTCPLPSEFTIETGNVCNLRCPGCPTGRREKSIHPGLLTYEDFATIFERIVPYAEQIHLFNWGEPFLNRDILAIIALCARNRVSTHIDSNLAVRDFTRDEADAIVSCGLTRLIASVDGASQATYERYRVGGDFDRAICNLRLLKEAMGRLGSNRQVPVIAWKFLVNAFNEHEMDRAKGIADDIGIPIYFDLMNVSDPSWLSSLHRKSTEEHTTRVQACVGDDEVLVSDHSRQHDLPPAAPRTQQLPRAIDEIDLHPQLYSWCMQPFNMALINWDGAVYPCCNVYGPGYALGNLLTERLEDIWNNRRFRSCREFLLNFGPRQNTGSICETLPCPVEKKLAV